MPSDTGLSGMIVATTLMNQDFAHWFEERRANRHFQNLEEENLALNQQLDRLLAQYNDLVARYNALVEDRKGLVADFEKMRNLCRDWQAAYERLDAWAKNIEEHGHTGLKR